MLLCFGSWDSLKEPFLLKLFLNEIQQNTRKQALTLDAILYVHCTNIIDATHRYFSQSPRGLKCSQKQVKIPFFFSLVNNLIGLKPSFFWTPTIFSFHFKIFIHFILYVMYHLSGLPWLSILTEAGKYVTGALGCLCHSSLINYTSTYLDNFDNFDKS